MQNQTNYSEETLNLVSFQCYYNILSNSDWEITEYTVPLDELNDLELKVLTKSIENKLTNTDLN